MNTHAWLVRVNVSLQTEQARQDPEEGLHLDTEFTSTSLPASSITRKRKLLPSEDEFRVTKKRKRIPRTASQTPTTPRSQSTARYSSTPHQSSASPSPSERSSAYVPITPAHRPSARELFYSTPATFSLSDLSSLTDSEPEHVSDHDSVAEVDLEPIPAPSTLSCSQSLNRDPSPTPSLPELQKQLEEEYGEVDYDPEATEHEQEEEGEGEWEEGEQEGDEEEGGEDELQSRQGHTLHPQPVVAFVSSEPLEPEDAASPPCAIGSLMDERHTSANVLPSQPLLSPTTPMDPDAESREQAERDILHNINGLHDEDHEEQERMDGTLTAELEQARQEIQELLQQKDNLASQLAHMQDNAHDMVLDNRDEIFHQMLTMIKELKTQSVSTTSQVNRLSKRVKGAYGALIDNLDWPNSTVGDRVRLQFRLQPVQPKPKSKRQLITAGATGVVAMSSVHRRSQLVAAEALVGRCRKSIGAQVTATYYLVKLPECVYLFFWHA